MIKIRQMKGIKLKMLNNYKYNNIENKNIIVVQRGDIWLVDFGIPFGSEQGGIRPSIIIQNDVGNEHSPTTLVCPLTSKFKHNIPTHVHLNISDGVKTPSVCECEQSRVVDKLRLKKKLGEVKNQNVMNAINKKIELAFGIA